jgi:hypothetical protein
MDWGREDDWGATLRWFGRRGSAFCVFFLAISAILPSPDAVLPSPRSELPSGSGVVLAPLAAHSPWALETASSRLGQYADGAIDSCEDDDFIGGRTLPPSVRSTESCAAPDFLAPNFASDRLAVTYPARGPPSA